MEWFFKWYDCLCCISNWSVIDTLDFLMTHQEEGSAKIKWWLVTDWVGICSECKRCIIINSPQSLQSSCFTHEKPTFNINCNIVLLSGCDNHIRRKWHIICTCMKNSVCTLYLSQHILSGTSLLCLWWSSKMNVDLSVNTVSPDQDVLVSQLYTTIN